MSHLILRRKALRIATPMCQSTCTGPRLDPVHADSSFHSSTAGDSALPSRILCTLSASAFSNTSSSDRLSRSSALSVNTTRWCVLLCLFRQAFKAHNRLAVPSNIFSSLRRSLPRLRRLRLHFGRTVRIDRVLRPM